VREKEKKKRKEAPTNNLVPYDYFKIGWTLSETKRGKEKKKRERRTKFTNSPVELTLNEAETGTQKQPNKRTSSHIGGENIPGWKKGRGRKRKRKNASPYLLRKPV